MKTQADGLPEVKALSSFVAYQEGAIVSRVLLKNSGGNVTLFAFGAGEGLREHTAAYDALVLNVEGQAEITVAGKLYTLQSGETITLPANVPHAVHALTDFKMLLTMIK